MRTLSPLRYSGAKGKFADILVSKFPPLSEIKNYCEPMLGGGGLSFYLLENGLIDGTYWLSDINAELINFYRELRDNWLNLDRVINIFHDYVQKNEEPKDAVKQLRDLGADDLTEAAAIIFMLNRCSYSGTTRSGGITDYSTRYRFTKSSIEKLGKCSALLNKREVELCYENVFDNLAEFNHSANNEDAGIFYYLDPPYYNVDGLYGKNGDLSKFDHELLAETLKGLNHKFLLSYNDCATIRELYQWAEIEELTLPYSMGNKKKGAELLIRNY